MAGGIAGNRNNAGDSVDRRISSKLVALAAMSSWMPRANDASGCTLLRTIGFNRLLFLSNEFIDTQPRLPTRAVAAAKCTKECSIGLRCATGKLPSNITNPLRSCLPSALIRASSTARLSKGQMLRSIAWRRLIHAPSNCRHESTTCTSAKCE